MMKQYGKAEYWEDRYGKDDEPFDWYQRFSGIEDVIINEKKAKLPTTANILHVGCGSSRK